MLFSFFAKRKIEISKRYDFQESKNSKTKKNKKLIIGVTVGRSGMTWVLEILKAHKNIMVEVREIVIVSHFLDMQNITG